MDGIGDLFLLKALKGITCEVQPSVKFSASQVISNVVLPFKKETKQVNIIILHQKGVLTHLIEL